MTVNKALSVLGTINLTGPGSWDPTAATWHAAAYANGSPVTFSWLFMPDTTPPWIGRVPFPSPGELGFDQQYTASVSEIANTLVITAPDGGVVIDAGVRTYNVTIGTCTLYQDAGSLVSSCPITQ